MRSRSPIPYQSPAAAPKTGRPTGPMGVVIAAQKAGLLDYIKHSFGLYAEDGKTRIGRELVLNKEGWDSLYTAGWARREVLRAIELLAADGEVECFVNSRGTLCVKWYLPEYRTQYQSPTDAAEGGATK
jgi:hypothetical protein